MMFCLIFSCWLLSYQPQLPPEEEENNNYIRAPENGTSDSSHGSNCRVENKQGKNMVHTGLVQQDKSSPKEEEKTSNKKNRLLEAFSRGRGRSATRNTSERSKSRETGLV